MVPFKDVFLGTEKRSYTRAVSIQKCLRVADLEDVGPSPQHQSFFEMLGNFSFGDYFKEEALDFSWEFLTKELGLPGDALHPTVYEEDDESAAIWARIKGIPVSAVVRLGADENFWSMGETGPCGPNSEIIFDRAGKCLRDGSDCAITCDCDRWWEVWNNVFMQFNRAADGTLTPLAKQGVDTGMGFERLVTVMQEVDSNYENDLFVPLFDRVRSLAGDGDAIEPERLMAYRAVTDHARACTFLIADGITPGNEGRGYVLRRILRRASYHGRLLGLDRPFLSDVCRGVIEMMGPIYPEVADAAERIADLVTGEEERFLTTLDAGLTRLEQTVEAAPANTTVLSGDEAFRLHDTFGFPLDLTRQALTARGWSVDEAGFERALEAQRRRGREALEEQRGEDEALLAAVGDSEPTRFLGFDSLTADADLAVLFSEGQRRDEANEGDAVEIVLAPGTPFYAEGGGQVGDAGRIVGENGTVAIEAVRRAGGGIFIHSGRVALGRIVQGEPVRAEVDKATRDATRRNHTATHLLHRALRMVVGDQAKQAGSLVAPDRLRFDFLYNKPLTEEQLREAERLVREQIVLDRPVHTDVMPLQEAIDLGADAMFDEKYGEEARVVSVNGDGVFSRELCGGTHCGATGQVGAFFIVEQRSVGAGVRRIEAVTGFPAYEYADARRDVVERLSREINVPAAELPERISALRERAREQPAVAAANLPKPSEVLAKAEKRNGTAIIIDRVDEADATALREFGDNLRRLTKSAAIVLGSVFDDKLNVIVMLTPDLVEGGLHAGKLAKQIGKEMGAGGGGRPDVATAGGDPARVDAGLALAKSLLKL